MRQQEIISRCADTEGPGSGLVTEIERMDRRRLRRLNRMKIMIGIILALAVLLGFVLVGFRIRTFEVNGNTRHTAQEIQDDLVVDFKTSNALFFCWKYRSPVQDPAAPYLSSVQAKLVSPGHVLVNVLEKKIIGCTVYGGSYVYFDEDAMVMEISDERIDNVPLISGIAMEQPEIYQKLPVSNAALLRTMLNVSALVQDSGLLADAIEFDENLNMTVVIGSIRIELGQDEYLEEKLSNLVTLYPKISDQSGILKLSSYTGRNEDTPFQQTFEQETESEIQTASTDAEGNPVIDVSGETTADAGTTQDPAAAQTQTGADGAENTQNPENAQEQDPDAQENNENQEVRGVEGFMVFDSSGTLRYDARVVGGRVVDASGNDIPGCSINEDGYVVDAYWNVIDPMTGTLAE